MTQRIPAAVFPLGLEALRCRLQAINATPMSVREYVSKKQFQSDAVRPPPIKTKMSLVLMAFLRFSTAEGILAVEFRNIAVMCGLTSATVARFQGWKLFAAESKKPPMNSQNLAFALIVNEAQFLEPVHEETNARPRSADHFCQSLMT